MKGVERVTLYTRHWSFGVSGSYQAVFDAPTSRGGYFPSSPVIGLEGSWHNFFGRGFGFGLDGLYGWQSGVVNAGLVSLNYNYSLFTLGTTGFYEWPDGTFVPYLGVRLGLDVMARSFPGADVPAQTFQTFTPGLVVGMRVRLSKNWSIGVRARLHYLLYNIDETRNFGYLELASVLGYELRD